jgi:hypothetical protein
MVIKHILFKLLVHKPRAIALGLKVIFIIKISLVLNCEL